MRIAKFSPIFKEAEVLPRRLPNFGKANNFVCLTIELPFFFKHTWIKLRREKLLCSASAGSHVRCRDKIIFFPVHLTLLSMVFTMETRNTSGSFLEMPMTPTWIRLPHQQYQKRCVVLLRLKHKIQHKPESRENNHLYMTIHSCTSNARDVFLTVDIVT